MSCFLCVVAIREQYDEKTTPLMTRMWIRCHCGNILKRRRVSVNTVHNCEEDYLPLAEVIRVEPLEANPPLKYRDGMLMAMIVRKRNCEKGGILTPGLKKIKREVRDKLAMRELELED